MLHVCECGRGCWARVTCCDAQARRCSRYRTSRSLARCRRAGRRSCRTCAGCRWGACSCRARCRPSGAPGAPCATSGSSAARCGLRQALSLASPNPIASRQRAAPGMGLLRPLTTAPGGLMEGGLLMSRSGPAPHVHRPALKSGAWLAAMPSLVLRACSCTACAQSKVPSPGLARSARRLTVARCAAARTVLRRLRAEGADRRPAAAAVGRSQCAEAAAGHGVLGQPHHRCAPPPYPCRESPRRLPDHEPDVVLQHCAASASADAGVPWVRTGTLPAAWCARGASAVPHASVAAARCPSMLRQGLPSYVQWQGQGARVSARARQQPWPCCPPAHGLNAGLNAPLDTADSVGCFYKPYLDPGRAGAPTAA